MSQNKDNKQRKEPTIAERALMVAGGVIALIVSLNIFFPGVLPQSQPSHITQRRRSYETVERPASVKETEDTSSELDEKSTEPEEETTSESAGDKSETTETEEQNSPEPPDDIAKKLPYENMPEAWIELTYLGKPDGIKENEELRIKLPHQKGSTWSRYEDALTTYYYWSAQNGTDDRIFAAYCYRGKVVKITKFNLFTTYWPDGIDGLPDRSADGSELKLSSDRTTEANRPDPFDYDNGEDYADDAEWWYEERGYSNPWAEALEYWDTNGPLDSETEF